MEEYLAVAPMHNRIYLDVIRAFMKAAPFLKLVAAFEPDFHKTMPDYARTYGIPYEWTQKYRIQKYGFHGASHCYIAQTLPGVMGRADANGLRAISCHLGGSSSLCALRNGLSIDTTMGFSSQSGVMNGTRNGDLDVYALFYLHGKGFGMDELNEALFTNGGLKGISGIGDDMRELEAAASSGNGRAQLALAVYCYEVKKYIGAYTAALGGLDALVFTGGIGENAISIRAEICRGLECLGIQLDAEKNRMGEGPEIGAENSAVKVYVIPTNEEFVIAQRARALLDKQSVT
jgi:acetate kinase